MLIIKLLYNGYYRLYNLIKFIKNRIKMEDFQNEVIGFTIVAVVVIMLAYYEARIRKRD